MKMSSASCSTRTFSRVMSPRMRTASPGPGKGWRLMRCSACPFGVPRAHLVFEEPLQRFADAQVHFLRQSAHIVVTLDDLAGNVERFDAIRIDGALCQPLRIGYFFSFGIEYFYKIATDNLALLFRISNPS